MNRMPKTRAEYENSMLYAFTSGMNAGYGVDHEKITEDEDAAIMDFAKRNGFKTKAVEKWIYERKQKWK